MGLLDDIEYAVNDIVSDLEGDPKNIKHTNTLGNNVSGPSTTTQISNQYAQPASASTSVTHGTLTTAVIGAVGSSVQADNITSSNSCLVTIHGVWTGAEIQFTISDDGTTFYSTNAIEGPSGIANQTWSLPDSTPVSLFTDSFHVATLGAKSLRVSAVTFSTGLINVIITPLPIGITENIHVGQATMARSEPVVIASDQSPIPVTESGTTFTTLATTQIAVGTVAVQLPTQTATQFTILNDNVVSTAPIYIGPTSAVSTTTGFPLTVGSSISISAGNSNLLWAISSVVSQQLDIIYGD